MMKRQFMGLSRGEGATFTMSPGRGELALLYDAFQVSWNNGSADPKRMPKAGLTLVASDGARGSRISLNLRGFATPSGAARLHVRVGQSRSTFVPPEEDFDIEAEGVLEGGSDSTDIEFELELPKPEEEGAVAQLTLDSVDIGLVSRVPAAA
jgi:hypothetical protein